MIIVKLTDGLGNQLFQYAAARRLAHAHNTILKLDLYDYSQNKFRRFGLDHFHINAETASWQEIARLCPLEGLHRATRSALPSRLGNFTIRALKKSGLRSAYHYRTVHFDPNRPLPPLQIGRVVSERFFHFDSELLSSPDEVCLSGFWQSEKYFKDISHIIRQELTVRKPMSQENKWFADQMTASESVSLHVRRGDKVQETHSCVTTADFCARAIRFFRAKLSNPKFFVFTDEWEWVKQNLPAGDQIVHVDRNDDAANYEDLRLMSLCKHNVIAPSSFSWWGAWLNGHSDKLVIRPIALTKIPNHSTEDFFPNDWIAIDQT